jgi:uncharacterized membrane protein YadS
VGLIQDDVTKPFTLIAGVLTIVSMAALGLTVDIRIIRQVGARVTFAVAASLIILLAVSLLLIRLLDIH